MRNWDREKVLDLLFKALLLLTLTVGFVVLVRFGLPTAGAVLKFAAFALLPFILAWLCAIISEGATDLLNKKLHMPRGLAVVVLMLLAFGIVGMLLALIIARLWVEIAAIAGNMSGYYRSVLGLIDKADEWLAGINLSTDELVKIREWVQEFFSDLGSWASAIAGGTVDLISATPVAFVFIIVFFVALFFFCRDNDKLVNKAFGLLPAAKLEKGKAIYLRFAEVIRGFCVAQLTLIGVSMLICIVFFFILDVDGALTLGLICGLLDILPVVGPTTLILPWAIISLIQGRLFIGIGLFLLLATLVIVKNVLQPKVVGDRIGLHPLLTLAGIFIGMRVFGLWGLALGPIILAMIVCIYRSVKEINGK